MYFAILAYCPDFGAYWAYWQRKGALRGGKSRKVSLVLLFVVRVKTRIFGAHLHTNQCEGGEVGGSERMEQRVGEIENKEKKDKAKSVRGHHSLKQYGRQPLFEDDRPQAIDQIWPRRRKAHWRVCLRHPIRRGADSSVLRKFARCSLLQAAWQDSSRLSLYINPPRKTQGIWEDGIREKKGGDLLSKLFYQQAAKWIPSDARCLLHSAQVWARQAGCEGRRAPLSAEIGRRVLLRTRQRKQSVGPSLKRRRR